MTNAPVPTQPAPLALPGRHRYELPVAPAECELAAARLWAAGALGLWEQADRLVAWFAEPTDDAPPGGTWSVEADRDWQAEWKATIAPVRAGRFLVVPSWLVDDLDAGETVLVLDPGRAFGTGHHATTILCLELLDGLELEGTTVADVGCGTGVLAIAAALRGADAVGVDIDPDAVAVARDNAARNGVEVTVAHGSVEALPGAADVVVANLVTDVVVALAPALAATTRRALVVSGLTVGRLGEVADALTGAGLTVVEHRERDGWVALLATRGGGCTA